MAVQTEVKDRPDQGHEGSPTGNRQNLVENMRNDEASAEVLFGHAVKHGSTTDEYSALNLTAITGERVAGIVQFSHKYSDLELGDDGLLPDAELNVAREGRLLVRCEDGCNVGDPLFIRAVATGGENPGALRATADGSDTIDMTLAGSWRTSAAAGELAVLEFDFRGVANP